MYRNIIERIDHYRIRNKENTVTDVTALYEAAAAGSGDYGTQDTIVQVKGLPDAESNTDPGTSKLFKDTCM